MRIFGTGGKIGFKQKPSIYAGFAVQKSVRILEKQKIHTKIDA